MGENERTILPANIRQVGTLSSGKRVYVEDYAATYLQQYANADNQREKAAFLIGQEIRVDGNEALFISGVIQGKYTTHKNGIAELTEKSWQYAKKQIDLYFKGLDVVGWAYVQPGYEDYIKDGIRDFQQENCERGLQVMLLIDPTEKINSFFMWSDEQFTSLKGYIIYYEKNEGMHEYMLENKLKPDNESYRLITDIDIENEPQAEEAFSTIRDEMPQTDEQLSSLRASRRRREEKKAAGIMSTFSFVMLMVCFVMGAGLVQNDKRINEMEQTLKALQQEMDSVGGTQSVFAADNSKSQTVAEILDYETTTQPSTQTTTEETTQESTTETAKEELQSEYVVEKGDTLSVISQKIYGTIDMMEDIMQLNGMEDADHLVEGMELTLPQ